MTITISNSSGNDIKMKTKTATKTMMVIITKILRQTKKKMWFKENKADSYIHVTAMIHHTVYI